MGRKNLRMSVGQFSVCNLLCSAHRVTSLLQPQLRSQGSLAQAAVAVSACASALQVSSSIPAAPADVWYKQEWRLAILSASVDTAGLR